MTIKRLLTKDDFQPLRRRGMCPGCRREHEVLEWDDRFEDYYCGWCGEPEYVDNDR